ncbi:MAG: hypothetical protein K5893_07030 [Prevotella sp.]|nr:hypothetical protein [Prevotella sp.]
MYYRIQKSLGRVSAIEVPSESVLKLCIGFTNYQAKGAASIIIYQYGNPRDWELNGWKFPCVYNNLIYRCSRDIYGGASNYTISFDVIDPNGSICHIKDKSIYGSTEILDVEYFYSLLYNMSCCKNIEQFKQLYKYIIDNNVLDSYQSDRKLAIDVLAFIENFLPQLKNVQQREYITELEQKIEAKFKRAQEIIASSDAPK